METRIFRGASQVELPLLCSERIPVEFHHGFTTRAGGVSAPPYASLNLGWKWGDDPGSVDENHRRLLVVSGAFAMVRATQVHGIRILRVGRGDDPAAVAAEQADGLVSDDPGLALSVCVADCTPILMACPRTGACAALHAGWRGTVAGMARAGVAAMVAHFGCRPQELRVALGPCIGRCCFEVGDEVVDAFVAAMPARHPDVVHFTPGQRSRIDLRAFQRAEIEAAGVLHDNVDASTDCTLCDAGQRFFSFRGAGRSTGQLLGFILRK
ncbi:MAG TPA: peptidoglycan editing factor PgeF [Polyangia bacterium]